MSKNQTVERIEEMLKRGEDVEALRENIDTGTLVLEANSEIDSVIFEPFLREKHLEKKVEHMFNMFDYTPVADTEKGKEQEYKLFLKEVECAVMNRLKALGFLEEFEGYVFKFEEGEDAEGEQMLGLTISESQTT